MTFFMPGIFRKNQAPRRSRPSERGSVFFWIFIMIALFGALSFAMTRGSRTGTTTLSDQQTRLLASEAITTMTQLKNTVRTLIVNGCTETTISFDSTPAVAAYNNTNSPTDKRCHVYEQNGGGLRYDRNNVKLLSETAQITYPQGLHPNFSAGNRLNGVGQDGKADLIVIFTGMSKSMCMQINTLLGVVNPSSSPPVEYNAMGTAGGFTGAYNDDVSPNFGLAPGTVPAGLREGCINEWLNGTPRESYHYYVVLLAR